MSRADYRWLERNVHEFSNTLADKLDSRLSARNVRSVLLYLQCSRLKPSFEFHLEGLSNFNPKLQLKSSFESIESKTSIQEHRIEIQNSY